MSGPRALHEVRADGLCDLDCAWFAWGPGRRYLHCWEVLVADDGIAYTVYMGADRMGTPKPKPRSRGPRT